MPTMKCPLEGRSFFCRQWVFLKLKQYVDARKQSRDLGSSSTNHHHYNGVLVIGQAGAGKTAIMCQMAHPTEPDQLQQELHSRVVASHFCQRFDAASQEVATFIRSLAEQLSGHPRVPSEYRRRYKSRDATIHSWLEPRRCLMQPLEAVYHAIVEPLLECNTNVQEPLLLIVDSLHECILSDSASNDSLTQAPLAQLVAQMASILPKWLIIVASVRGNCRASDQMFQSFRKINLDDLRRSYAVNDIQQYILTRLDHEPGIRAQLDLETAQMLNQLHIKSAGCILYLQTVLDGVRDGFIRLREINNIPSTLQGLYLWLCQRLFTTSNIYPNVRLLLEILLASRKPLSVREIYQVAKSSRPDMTKSIFAETLKQMGPLLIEYECPTEREMDSPNHTNTVRCLTSESTVLIFHPSFEEWLQDVKYCTRKYLCNPSDGHMALAVNYASAGASLRPEQIVCFAYHLTRCTGINDHQDFLLDSGAAVQDLVLDCPVIDQATTKLLLDSGADFVNLHTDSSVESLDKIVEKDNRDTREQTATSSSGQADSLIDDFPLDSDDRCALHDAAAAGDCHAVDRLIASGVYVDAEDPRGDTAVCLAARAGYPTIIDRLSSAGASLDHLGHEQWTPLRSAAFAAHLDTVQMLIRCGASIDHCGADSRRALRAAAWAGHVDVVRLLLDNGAEIDARDDQERTALMTAAYMAHGAIVELLLLRGAKADAIDVDGRSALILAAIAAPPTDNVEPHLELIGHLVKYGANLNLRDKLGRTALFTAAIENLISVCMTLAKYGADLELCDDLQNSPLSAAASCGHYELVRKLIDSGASVDCVDSDGRTALTVAAAQGHIRVVETLLEIELDEMHADNNGWLPIHHAAFGAHHECCDRLGRHNCQSVDAIDKEGRTALFLAAQEGHTAVVRSLLQIGADPDVPSHLGCTALRAAALQNHSSIVELLLAQPSVDVNTLDIDGNTILLSVVSANVDTELMESLLKHGATVDATDGHHRTSLHIAAALGNTQAINVLLGYGANIDAKDCEGRTPLMNALWANQFESTRTLLARGAEPNYCCHQKASALSIAAQLGNQRAVKLLLSHRADLTHKDAYGRTAEDVARLAGHTQMASILSNTSSSSPLLAVNSTISPRHKPYTTVSPHSSASTSGVSANGDSPPSTWQPANSSRSDQSSTLSSMGASPEHTFAKQLKQRSSTRPFSGIFNIPPPTEDPLIQLNNSENSGSPREACDSALSCGDNHSLRSNNGNSSTRRRSNIVTNPKIRRSNSRSSTGLTLAAPPSPQPTDFSKSICQTNLELQKATEELEQFLLCTSTETSVV